MVKIMAGGASGGFTLQPLLLLLLSLCGTSEGELRWSGRELNTHQEGLSAVATSLTDLHGAYNFESLKLGFPVVEGLVLGNGVLPTEFDGQGAASRGQGTATRSQIPTRVFPESNTDSTFGNIGQGEAGVRGEGTSKRELARSMREQFDVFKERLARTVQESPFSPPPTAPPGATNTTDGEVGSSGAGSGGREGRVLIGEMVSKSERRAGEDPSGIKSGILRLDAHPIPVTFTSLPGFPLFPRTTTVGSAGVGVGGVPASVGTVTGDTTAVPGVGPGTSVGTLTPVRTDPATVSRGPGLTRVPGGVVGTRLTGVAGGGFRRTPSGTSEGDSNGVGNLMRLLESRLIGGIRGATTTTSPIQHFDPSIVVNFLTLVALSQQQRRGGSGSSAPGQRNAALAGGAPLTLPTSAAGSEFGPFSTGDDPSAGVDPSSILLPPMLRQTLYSYLLPRLASLTALVETIPGVPGLDYPIISTVPYTNFYCSDMPWPGFYADTEARCQVWHYCDLDGRQASFLCPNGTMFNQAFFVCDWWYNLDCQSAPYLYSLNERVFALPEVDETAPHRTLTAEILDTIFL